MAHVTLLFDTRFVYFYTLLTFITVYLPYMIVSFCVTFPILELYCMWFVYSCIFLCTAVVYTSISVLYDSVILCVTVMILVSQWNYMTLVSQWKCKPWGIHSGCTAHRLFPYRKFQVGCPHNAILKYESTNRI